MCIHNEQSNYLANSYTCTRSQCGHTTENQQKYNISGATATFSHYSYTYQAIFTKIGACKVWLIVWSLILATIKARIKICTYAIHSIKNLYYGRGYLDHDLA